MVNITKCCQYFSLHSIVKFPRLLRHSCLLVFSHPGPGEADADVSVFQGRQLVGD